MTYFSGNAGEDNAEKSERGESDKAASRERGK